MSSTVIYFEMLIRRTLRFTVRIRFDCRWGSAFRGRYVRMLVWRLSTMIGPGFLV